MAMYHEDHPDRHYETANRVRVFERPTAISWETGYDAGDGSLRFGGWLPVSGTNGRPSVRLRATSAVR